MLNRLIVFLEKHPLILPLAFLLLCIPAFFINLGLTPLLGDEGTRALVALELEYNQNYWVPTINGEYYYNKPPLYNWLLSFFFQITGRYDEWIIRLPAVLSLFAFSLTLFLFTRPYIGSRQAFLLAVMNLTYGRMIIYSSLLGHIDIFYSWITFLSFMAIIHYYQREEWQKLFALSYFLAGLGFLQKGLPSIAFQGLSLLAVFGYHRNFKQLFSWQHVTGVLSFLLLVSVYFYRYTEFNDPRQFLLTIWDQSQQRTVTDSGFLESIAHLFTFPFENLLHLAPWSVLVVCFFTRGALIHVLSNPFHRVVLLLLGANIIVYWLSPHFIPRYIFMLNPFVFILLLRAYELAEEWNPRSLPFIHSLMLTAILGLSLSCLALFFVELDVPFKYGKMALLMVTLMASGYLFFRLERQRLLVFGIAILLFRIGFDWFVLPHRVQTNDLTLQKEMQIDIGQKTKGQPLYIYRENPMTHYASFYISREREEVLRVDSTMDPSAYYLAADWMLGDASFEIQDTLYLRYAHWPVYLIRFVPDHQPD